MPTRTGSAEWQGNVQDGSGHIHLLGDNYPFSYKTRLDDKETETTSPEELIGTALAACYSMALSARLSSQHIVADNIQTRCRVTLSPSGLGLKISRIVIHTRAAVPELTNDEFVSHAQVAKENCPVSNALMAVPLSLDAALME